MTPTSRDTVLARIRNALAYDVPVPAGSGSQPVPRDYLTVHAERTPEQAADLLADNLADYRAHVHRARPDNLAAVLAGLLAARGTRTVIVPPGVPRGWLAEAAGVELRTAEDGWTPAGLDAVDTVVTGCALAIAETGTIVLDAAPDQGPRALTLVPDHHICVIDSPRQVVGSVPLALPRLDPARPLTWISGPSATSDIELDRVEGVHGPRTLDVILVSGSSG